LLQDLHPLRDGLLFFVRKLFAPLVLKRAQQGQPKSLSIEHVQVLLQVMQKAIAEE